MKAYIITYDFKKEEADVSDLAEAIKGFGFWWHYLKHSWIIKTDRTVQQVYDKLAEYLQDDMHLLVFELGKQRQGWLPKKAWGWLKKNVPKQ